MAEWRIYASENQPIIGLDKAIIWTNAGFLRIEHLGIGFEIRIENSEIFIQENAFGLNILISNTLVLPVQDRVRWGSLL